MVNNICKLKVLAAINATFDVRCQLSILNSMTTDMRTNNGCRSNGVK
jgi:hypothetical protein